VVSFHRMGGCPLWVISFVLIGACAPDLDDRESIVEGPRVLAIQSEPAETRETEVVVYRTLFVGPDGVLEASHVEWAHCNWQKPLAVLAPVDPRCLEPENERLVQLGRGETATGQIPTGACRRFGPEIPETGPDEPPGRPVDPDGTGGYYQPLRVRVPSEAGDDYAVGFTRLLCGLAGATGEQVREFGRRYRANTNPRIDGFEVTRADGSVVVVPPLESEPPTGTISVSPGERLVFRASWGPCGEGVDLLGEGGCTGAEPFLDFDPVERELLERKEAIRLAWFATGGEYDEDRTGVTPEEDLRFSENGWVAPSVAGLVDLWVVIRDDRGGVSWRHYQLDVR
jgi:hypothetical protein